MDTISRFALGLVTCLVTCGCEDSTSGGKVPTLSQQPTDVPIRADDSTPTPISLEEELSTGQIDPAIDAGMMADEFQSRVSIKVH